jgi:cytochrome c551/c552
VRVVDHLDLQEYAGRGAIGLIVPGSGATVTRASALASLERGKIVHALLGGTPTGRVVVHPSNSNGSLATVYVSLPPPGRTHNTRRYPIAVVGCGLQGLLTSRSTRIAGLISVADIAPAVKRGTCDLGPLDARRDGDAVRTVRRLDARIAHVHDVRGWTAFAVLITVAALALFGAPGVAGCVAAVVASLILSAADVEGFWALLVGVVGITIAIGFAAGRRRLLAPLVAVFLLAFLLVLALDTNLNSLAVLGARPDGGGRFYGIGNQVETLLLAPTLAAASLDGLAWLVAVGVLAVLTIGWSHAGADGGGLIVYAVGLAFLALRLSRARLTLRRAIGAAVAVAALAIAFVALDAALGGSSHVTHAAGSGPGTVFGDIGRRLHLSYLSITSSWAKAAEFFAGGIAPLVVLGARFYRRPVVGALLVALAASLLVNDTPVDVAWIGALACWTLVWWESVDSRAMRRRPVVLFGSALTVLALAGCGSKGTTQAVPQTVVGTLQQAAPGKGLFTSNGCNGCHTYAPANATGKIGPDLDKLASYAKKAKQPLAAFVHESIVDPNKYVEKGFPKGVMPSFKQLPASDVQALVDFLTKPQSAG